MDGRKRINDQLGTTLVIEIGGERVLFTECYRFAEMENMQANIQECVLKTLDDRFLRLTVVGDDEIEHGYGVLKGWYVARMIDAAEADKWHAAWAVLREQPGPPMGPWR